MQRLDQRGLIDEFASAHVHVDRARLHPVQRGGIDGLIKSLQQKNAASEKPRTAQAEQK